MILAQSMWETKDGAGTTTLLSLFPMTCVVPVEEALQPLPQTQSMMALLAMAPQVMAELEMCALIQT